MRPRFASIHGRFGTVIDHQTASLTAAVSARHAECVLLGSFVVEELDFVVSVAQLDSALSFLRRGSGVRLFRDRRLFGLSTQTPIVVPSTLLAVTDRTIRSTAPSKPRVIELIARS